MWVGERQRERETQNPKQAPDSEPSAQSPTWRSNLQAVRSWPELKSDAQPTQPPRFPGNDVWFLSRSFICSCCAFRDSITRIGCRRMGFVWSSSYIFGVCLFPSLARWFEFWIWWEVRLWLCHVGLNIGTFFPCTPFKWVSPWLAVTPVLTFYGVKRKWF